MDLVRKRLRILLPLQIPFERLHRPRILILTRQRRKRNRNALRVLGIKHCRMRLDRALKRTILLREQRGDLAAPAEAEQAPCLEAAAVVGGELVRFGEEGGDLGGVCWGRGFGGEEVGELCFLVFGVRGEPGELGGVALEEVGDEDA
ncbi:hypothetical protein KEM56_000774, partial [Ascosphaera pollenicola]